MTRSQEFRIIGYIFLVGGFCMAAPLFMRLLIMAIGVAWFFEALRAAKLPPTSETQEGAK